MKELLINQNTSRKTKKMSPVAKPLVTVQSVSLSNTNGQTKADRQKAFNSVLLPPSTTVTTPNNMGGLILGNPTTTRYIPKKHTSQMIETERYNAKTAANIKAPITAIGEPDQYMVLPNGTRSKLNYGSVDPFGLSGFGSRFFKTIVERMPLLVKAAKTGKVNKVIQAYKTTNPKLAIGFGEVAQREKFIASFKNSRGKFKITNVQESNVFLGKISKEFKALLKIPVKISPVRLSEIKSCVKKIGSYDRVTTPKNVIRENMIQDLERFGLDKKNATLTTNRLLANDPIPFNLDLKFGVQDVLKTFEIAKQVDVPFETLNAYRIAWSTKSFSESQIIMMARMIKSGVDLSIK